MPRTSSGAWHGAAGGVSRSRLLLLGRGHGFIPFLLVVQIAFGVLLSGRAWQAQVDLHERRAAPSGIAERNLVQIPWIKMGGTADPASAEVLKLLRRIPGVRSAGAANQVPYGQGAWSSIVRIDANDERRLVSAVYLADEGFMRTLGLQVAHGRGFLPEEYQDYPGDQTALHLGPAPAIVSGTLATRLFGDADALGRTFHVHDHAPLRVVGVVPRLPVPAAARRDDDPPLAMILPVRMTRAVDAHFLLRHDDADPVRLVRDVRQVLSSAYPGSVIGEPVDLASLREASFDRTRLHARWWWLSCGIWWLFTLTLLMAGGQRWCREHEQELSLRRAAGATRHQIARALRLEYLLLALAGGSLGAMLWMHVVPDLPFPWSIPAPTTPAVACMLAATLLVVQSAAEWPVWLAGRVPPHLVSRAPSVRL